MAKAKSPKIKLNPLERWQKAHELYRAIEVACFLAGVPLWGKPLEEFFSSSDASAVGPEVKAMYDLSFG